MNYDQIRTGRTLELKAKQFADKITKDMEPDEANVRYPVEYNKELSRLTLLLNQEKLKQMPASSVTVGAENENDIVIRYSLKEGVTQEQAQAVMAKRENLICSPDFDGSEVAINTIMQEAFDIVEVTLAEAVENPLLAREPMDLFKVKPQQADKDMVAASIEDNPFEAQGIKAEHLNSRLEQLDQTHADLAKTLELHHKTVEKWTREGVPRENAQAVLDALA